MRKDNYQVSVLIFLTDAFTLSGTTWGLNVQCIVIVFNSAARLISCCSFIFLKVWYLGVVRAY